MTEAQLLAWCTGRAGRRIDVCWDNGILSGRLSNIFLALEGADANLMCTDPVDDDVRYEAGIWSGSDDYSDDSDEDQSDDSPASEGELVLSLQPAQ
jgi:hypothetical protein